MTTGRKPITIPAGHQVIVPILGPTFPVPTEITSSGNNLDS